MFKLLIILGFLAVGPKALYAAENPAQTVKEFYNVYVEVKPLGIPDEESLSKLSPYLTPNLIALLGGANEAEKKYKEATKGEVPPLVEGDVFSSLFEGAHTAKVLSCEEKSDSSVCTVEFSNTNPGDNATVKWKDEVVLKKTESGWLIDNIEYKGGWDFAQNGTLTDLLKSVIREGSAESRE